MVGEILDGKYRIVRPVGSGGMGTVYEAVHEGTGRRVAVKVVNGTDSDKKDELLVARFQREARAAGAIESQHIGQVLDTGTYPVTGMPYLVMEFLEGDDLQTVLLRHGPLSPEVTLRIAAQTCFGLQKAHEAGIIHRDIKPANIFLARGDDSRVIVKVLDFGIAKIRGDGAISKETGGLTRTGSMIGSPLYMSPEQARGAKVIDARADVWSLGVVMFEALTNRTPYQDIDALGELILAICSQVPPIVQDYAPWVPKEIAAIVHRCLAIPPDQRYANVAELTQALKAHLHNGTDLSTEYLTPVEDAARSWVAPRLEVAEAFALSNVMAPAGRSSLPSLSSISQPGASHAGSSQPGLANSGSNPGGTMMMEGAPETVASGQSTPGHSQPGHSQPGHQSTNVGFVKTSQPGAAGRKKVLWSALAVALVGGGIAAWAIVPSSNAAGPAGATEAAVGSTEEDAANEDDGEAGETDTDADEPEVSPDGDGVDVVAADSETEGSGGADAGDDPDGDSDQAPPPTAGQTNSSGGWKPPPTPTQTTADEPPPPPPPESGVDISGFGDRK